MTPVAPALANGVAELLDAGLLRVVLEHSEQGISVYDGERRLILWNDRWLKLLELPAKFGRLSTPLHDVLLWQASRGDFGNVDPVAEARRRLKEFGTDRVREWERRTVDGTWLHFRRTPIAGGGVATFVTDVTAGRTREEALAERQIALQTVLENMDQGIVMIDGAHRVVTANQTALDWFGLTRDEHPVGIPYREVIRRLYARSGMIEPQLSQRIERDLSDPNHFAARVYRLSIRDHRTVEVHQRPLADGGVVRVYTDISDRLRAEEDLQVSRSEAIEATRLLADALDNSTDGFVLWDRDCRLIIWNAAYSRLVPGVADILKVGLPLTEFVTAAVGRGALQKRPDQSDEDAIRDWLERYQQNTTYEHHRAAGGWMLSSNRVLADGSILWTRTDITPIKAREAEQAEYARRLEDLTQKLDLARLEAESASRAKSRFLAQVSHELRTPLNAIIGFSDMMRSRRFGELDDERRAAYAEDIYAAGSHLLQVINQILDLAKVEAGRMTIEPQRNSLKRLVLESVKLISTQAEAAHLRLEADVDELPLWADRRLAKQALVNILSNAIKFTLPGGTIRIAARIAEGMTVVSISDTGAGMTEEEIATALKPFGRVASAAKRAPEGTGLGLPLAKAFVELHGGRLEIDSERGRGTAIRPHFPLSPA
ncbi:MAG: PAS domain-containing protein [Alphaproteobacteria bacterium]|nr:PAS domain-containing protein [Alphaproteobacteria bacterium]